MIQQQSEDTPPDTEEKLSRLDETSDLVMVLRSH
jgi:hypothetical protein